MLRAFFAYKVKWQDLAGEDIREAKAGRTVRKGMKVEGKEGTARSQVLTQLSSEANASRAKQSRF